MKAGWQTKVLRDVCSIQRDQGIHKHLPYVGMEHIEPETGRYIGSLEPYEARSLTFKFSPGHLLFGRLRPYLNKVMAPDFVGHCSTEIIPIEPAPELSRHFLHYWFLRQHTVSLINATCTGARMPRANIDAVLGFDISVPPLAEQQRIVRILDQAFDAIATAKANAEKNLRNASALFESVLVAAIIGEMTRDWRSTHQAEENNAKRDLSNLIERIQGVVRKTPRKSEDIAGNKGLSEALPKEWQLAPVELLFNIIDYRGKNPPRSTDGKRLITAKNIKMGYISEEPVTFVSEKTYKKWMVRGFPKLGDILFVTEGHTMGFVALNTRTDDFALAQRTITLQPVVPFSTNFFFYFMLSSYFQDLVRLNATGAAAVGMKASKFRRLPLPFPSFAEQNTIIARLDVLLAQTQRLEFIYQQKLTALDALKKCLLHHAFTGAL